MMIDMTQRFQASHGCCGMYELHDLFLGKPEDAVKRVAQRPLNTYNSAYVPLVVFSDNVANPSCGSILAKYITKNKLGPVTASRIKVNPNTTNKIRAWIWNVNQKSLLRWAIKNKIRHI